MLKISFDGPLDIATGKTRKTANWKNTKLLWSELVARLTKTHRTAETYADYMAFKRDKQDEIKDVGGFVGGYLVNGKRKKGSVAHRQIITLDIDSGTGDEWENFGLLNGCAACIYSTHKHSRDTPRYRLVIPLSREISADEYEPICRRIAADIGIEAFTDTTTYQEYRLMYWPSTSSDGLFFSDQQDGPWLDPDTVLATYRNWKDVSEWPAGNFETEQVRRDIKKQEDPLEKRGVIGAFCRTYGIAEVIEKYLGDVYTEGTEGRYTYVHGSTGNGAVVYEDKWLYSHHGSDPCSGKLCNAFDLVRAHKFGLQDTGEGDKDSIKQMQRLCLKDKEVIGTLGREKWEEAKEDFQPVAGVEVGEQVEDTTITEADLEYLKEMEADKQGGFLSTIGNIYRFLNNDKGIKGKLYFDEFENWLKIKGNLPWRVVRPETRDFSDDDTDCLKYRLEGYGIPFTHLQSALAMIRNDNKIHPVRDYINGLVWDGEDRLDTLFIDYLGADDNEYVRSATRKTFVAAVARVFEPGCKFDTVLTLVGEEGIGKSQIIYRMAGMGKWFSDSLGNIHDRSGMESLRGVWLMEIAELAGFSRADEEAIKRFISSPVDVYRPAYGRQQVRYPRQCVFIATSNTEDFLKGAHVHRRFLPVGTDTDLATKDLFKDLTENEIGQIWAEAFTYYQAGESLDLSKEVKQLAAKVREKHTEVDDRAGMIRDYISKKLPVEWEKLNVNNRTEFIKTGKITDFDYELEGTEDRRYVCVQEIWCELFERKRSEMTRQNTKFIHDILKKTKGWYRMQKLKRFSDYGPVIGYEKVV